MVHKVLVADFVVGLSGDVDQIVWCRAREANIRFPRLAWPVNDATNHRHIHGRADIFKTVFQLVHRADHIKVLARATRAGNEIDAIGAQLQALQNLKAHLDLFHRIGGQ